MALSDEHQGPDRFLSMVLVRRAAAVLIVSRAGCT